MRFYSLLLCLYIVCVCRCVCIYVCLNFEPRGFHNTSGKSGEIGEEGILYLYLLVVEKTQVQVRVRVQVQVQVHMCIYIRVQFSPARDGKSLRS